ncbi:MAG: hypothetical protein ACLUFV_13875 [Acutalibacteraceae bacterium]
MKNRKLSLTAVLLIVFFACLVTFMTTFVLLRSSYEAKLGGDIVSSSGEGESGIDFDKLLEVDAYVRANFIGTVDYEKPCSICWTAICTPSATNTRFTTRPRRCRR